MLVPKKDGSQRICADYQKLYAVTQPDPYPMPRVDDLIDNLEAAIYLNTLDLTKEYWQMPVETTPREKVVFVTFFGKYQLKVIAFGLVGAPTICQHMMSMVLGDMSDTVLVYMDDMI